MPGDVGARLIVYAETDIIRRLFDEYSVGKSPKDIAHGQNADGVARPNPPEEWVFAEVRELAILTLKRYEEQVAGLQAALFKGIRSGDTEAAQAMGELVATVTVSRGANRKGGVEIEIAGRLNHLLGPKVYPQGVRAVWGAMVAEEGLEPPTRGL